MKKILVQKYGGVTVASPEKIKSVAKSVHSLSEAGYQLIVVVSAMGKTTNELIQLAQKISEHPDPREMDMLLSTGERISMALMSMALNDLGVSSISFTGSQAGIMTNDSHINAQIGDVKPIRVAEALEENKIVVLAGFQGVSPKTKEITTLGRGGSDTTAVALAAAFKAERCEILKEVPGVMSADPKKVPPAKRIEQLSYQQMLEMTFWGAQVLHYRSVELAMLKKVPLYVGSSTQDLSTEKKEGTMISDLKQPQFESSKVLAINSHSEVLQVEVTSSVGARAWQHLLEELQAQKISSPQLLFSQKEGEKFLFFVTGPKEWIESVLKSKNSFKKIRLGPKELSTISLTCSGVTQPDVITQVCNLLSNNNIHYHEMILKGLSVVLLIDNKDEEAALQLLHQLVS